MKSVRFIFALVLLAAVLTGCSSNVSVEVSPSPSVAPSPSDAAPGEAAAALPDATSNLTSQTDTFIAVGDKAAITVGSTKLSGKAYYPSGDEKTMLLPVVEVCKALGWQVEEPAGTGASALKMTRSGMDEVVVNFNMPATDSMGALTGVTATKGESSVDAAGESFAWIDGQLYATEAFISKAVQEIEVDYDGAASITVNAKA